MSKSARDNMPGEGQTQDCRRAGRLRQRFVRHGSTTRRNLLQVGAGLAAATGLPRGLGRSSHRSNYGQPPAGAEHRRSDDRPGAPSHALAGRLGGEAPAVAATPQAPRSLFPARLHRGMSVLAVARVDANGPLFAREPRNPDLSVAWPGRTRTASRTSPRCSRRRPATRWSGKASGT